MNRDRKRWDQAAKRKTIIYTDQHGREWAGTKDVFADAPIGTLLPMNFSPVKYRGQELIPPMKYFQFDDARPGWTRIDYAAWEADLLTAKQSWEESAGSYAVAMYGDKAMEAVENPPPALLNVLGPKTMPVELVQAQAEGNRWILGFNVPRPSWADDFFKEAVAVPGQRRFLDADDEVETRKELVAAGKATRDPSTGRFTSAEGE
jgi:hypothetical protein